MLVAASLGLGTRLVTQLTVYMPSLDILRCDLVRDVATTHARAITACYPGQVDYYYTTTPLK